MIAKGRVAITVNLELDELEAKWLKDLMQNSFHEAFQSVEGFTESQTDTSMREIFWNALEEAGV